MLTVTAIVWSVVYHHFLYDAICLAFLMVFHDFLACEI